MPGMLPLHASSGDHPPLSVQRNSTSGCYGLIVLPPGGAPAVRRMQVGVYFRYMLARCACAAFCAVLVATACGGAGGSTGAGSGAVADNTPDVAAAEDTPEPVSEPQPTFINLLPWGEVDFTRGEFPSREACNAFVRALPGYSGYTTPERCEPIDDPVYCTVWQDPDDPQARIDCFRGVGGCEVELQRHDLLAESRGRTIAARCGPTSLADAWAQYQSHQPDPEP